MHVPPPDKSESAAIQFRLGRRDVPYLSRFLVVGLGNFVVTFGAYLILYQFLLQSRVGSLGAGHVTAVVLANVVSYLIGVINSFVWNRSWTFEATESAVNQFRRFLLLNLGVLGTTSLLIAGLVDAVSLDYRLAWLVASTVGTVVNYIFSRDWVFG